MVVDRFPVVAVPLVGSFPDHPPDAVHEVASALLQLNEDAVPLAMLAGFAVNVTVGGGGGVIVSWLLAETAVSAAEIADTVTVGVVGTVAGAV